MTGSARLSGNEIHVLDVYVRKKKKIVILSVLSLFMS